MSEFVEECRREWKRLGVPAPVANEMAADLAADLHEADAEGVSPEEVLGSGAFDPQSFAASWAAERGVIDHPRSHSRVRRPLVVGVLVLVLAAGVGVAAAMLVSDSNTPATGTTAPAASVTVPYVVGLELMEAIAQAESRGFSVQFTYRNTSAAASGTVIVQKPAAGAEVTRGKTLALVVAR